MSVVALALRYWWAVVIAALLALLGAQTLRLDAAQTAMAEHLADDATARAAAETQARETEARHQAAFNEQAKRAQDENDALRTELASLADAGDGLRDELAQFKRRAAASRTCPAVGGPGKPPTDPVDLLAHLYTRADAEAAILARYADELRIAGSACERATDALGGQVPKK